jgi:hypothetical protein
MNKSSSEPKIEVVNAKIESNSVIKTIKTMFDITKTGYAGPGQKKTNQDNFFIHKNFNNNPNSIFMGVWYNFFNKVTDTELSVMKLLNICEKPYLATSMQSLKRRKMQI